MQADRVTVKAELAGPSPSPLERLLVQRIVACWLQVHFADGSYAQLKHKDVNIAVLKACEQRMDRANRRYLAAIKQLATVRKLLAPALSPVELARRQIVEGDGQRPARQAQARASFTVAN